MAAFVWRRMVEFADTDAAGVVHFTAYFRFMEAAEHAFLRSRGIETCGKGNSGVLWPRVACEFSYKAPLHYDDEAEVRLTIEKLGNASITYRAEVLKGDRVVAVGRSTNACCRLTTHGVLEAMPIPDVIRQKLEA